MADTILTNDLIAEYVAAYFLNSCKAIDCAYMPFDVDFDREINGYNVGNTLRYRLPTYKNVQRGIVAQPESLVERYAEIVLNNPINSSWNPNLLQLTTDMNSNEMILERDVKPSVIRMANLVDSDILDLMETSVYNVVGTAGATVNSFAGFNAAPKALQKFGVLGDPDYRAIMNVDDSGYLQNGVSNFFNDTINREVDIDGELGRLAGVKIYYDQNIRSHTNGTFAGGPITIKTNVANGATSFVLTGFTASQTGVLKRGDIIYVAGVYAVNPVSLNAVGVGTANLAKFIVQADVDSDGAGDATVPISPTVVFDGLYNNVSALPAATNVVSLYGGANATYTNNFVFSKDAILLAIKPYFKPLGLAKEAMGTYVDDRTKLSFSVTDWFNGQLYTNLKRIDLLYGIKIQPEYCVRLIG